MSSLVPDNWATDERTRNVVMISALLLDYEPFWGTEKTLTKRRLDPCMLNMKSKINNMLQTDKRTNDQRNNKNNHVTSAVSNLSHHSLISLQYIEKLK